MNNPHDRALVHILWCVTRLFQGRDLLYEVQGLRRADNDRGGYGIALGSAERRCGFPKGLEGEYDKTQRRIHDGSGVEYSVE